MNQKWKIGGLEDWQNVVRLKRGDFQNPSVFNRTSGNIPPICHSSNLPLLRISPLGEKVPVFAQPAPRVLVVGARMCDKAPEVARMVEPPEMHQLVNQHILADVVWHQYEPPVETDVTGRRA